MLSPRVTNKVAGDSLSTLKHSSLPVDTLKLKKSTEDFDAEVDYKADGKIRINNSRNKIFMYKNASVKYKDIELTADFIELNRDSNIVHAK